MKLFGFGSSTPPPPPPPSKPPSPPAKPAATPSAATAKTTSPQPTDGTTSIVGRWKEPNGADTTEFHADGTVTERAGGGETIRGRYSLEGGKLKIKLDGVPDEIVLTATVTGDSLETRDTEGQVTRYAKA